MNYIGYFSSLDKHRYSIKFITNSTSSEYEEITLADSPFTEDNSCESVFQPLIEGHAQINVYGDDYLFDIYSNHHNTDVILTDEDTNEMLWCGKVQPNMSSQDYSECNVKFTITADNYLSILQYFPYKPLVENKKGSVTFRDIVSKAISNFPLIKGFYWSKTKFDYDDTYLSLNDFSISEQNFYSNDNDEPMSYQEILTEMCKYLGITCFQYKNYLYFIDYQEYNINTNLSFWKYDFNNIDNPVSVTLGSQKLITKDSYAADSHDLTYTTPYNKIQVRSRFSNVVGSLIPDIFDEANLKNRKDSPLDGVYGYTPYCVPYFDTKPDNYKCYYKNKKGSNERDENDEDIQFYIRLYDNNHWTSKYRSILQSSIIHSGGEIGDVLPLDSIYDPNDPLFDKERYKTINVLKDCVGGTIIDYSGWKIKGEQPANLSFQKYLLIHQDNNPAPNISWNNFDQNRNCYSNNLNSVFELKPNHTIPIFASSGDTYLVINANAIFTRYPQRYWLNNKQDNNQGRFNQNDPTGAYTDTPVVPTLNFTVGINGKYWGGSRWVDNECSFSVPLMGSKDEDNNPTYNDFNTNLSVQNNISWREFTGLEGYKIPIPDGFVSETDLIFRINLPNRTTNVYDSNLNGYHWDVNNNGNGYIWLSNISLKIGRKFDELRASNNTNGNDVLYENVIDEDSVNQLDTIELKFTTDAGNELAYSNVALKNSLLTGVVDKYLDWNGEEPKPQKPEENLIQKYYQQYSKPRVMEQLEIKNNLIKPYDLVRDTWWDDGKKFIPIGNTIDYETGIQTIILNEMF